MKKLTFLVAVLSLLTITQTYAQSKKSNKVQTDLSMFPAPKAGYKQVYIQLPTKKNENNYKVEIYVGKNIAVDCNNYFMMGNMTEETVNGWGYNYFNVKSDGNIAGTRMGCPDNKKTTKFIHLQTQLTRYNSKLPIVIYVPSDFEVKYKIWTAGNSFANAKTNPIQNSTVTTTGIENKKWQLVELNGKPIKGTANTHYIIFNSKDGKISAKANCNIISRSYTIKNGFQINIGDGLSTLMACPDNVEQEFNKMLSTIDNFTTDGTTLSLNKARMAPLAKFKLVK